MSQNRRTLPETYFRSIISSDGKCLKIKSEWESNQFKLNILLDCESWECVKTAADIRRELPNIDVNEFINVSKQILVRKDKHKLCEYQITESMFLWGKKNGEGKLVFSGYANLKKVPYNESIVNFVEAFLNLNARLAQEVKNLEEKNDILEADSQDLLASINEEINKKNKIEYELLTKFYRLLEEKTKMVSTLKELTLEENK